MAEYLKRPVIAYQFYNEKKPWPEGVEIRGTDDVPSVLEWEDNRTYVHDGDYVLVNYDGSMRVSSKCDFERDYEPVRSSHE